MGGVYYSQKDFNSAIEYFKLVLGLENEKAKFCPDFYYFYGKRYDENKLPSVTRGKLIKDLYSVVDDLTLFYLASSYEELGDYENSEICFKKQYENNPKNSIVIIKLAESAYRNKDYVSALDYFKKAFEVDKNLDKYRLKANGISTKFFIEMDPSLGRYSNNKSHLLKVNSTISKCYIGLNKYNKANLVLEQNIKIDSLNSSVYVEIVDFNMSIADSTKAIDYLNQGLTRMPYDTTLLSCLASLYQKQTKYQLAADTYKYVYEIYPEDKSVLSLIGYNFLMLGNYNEAIDYYNKALENKKEAGYYKNIGISYSSLGQRDKAIESFEKAIELSPGDDNIYYNLSILYFNKRDKPNAIKYINKAIDNAPNNDMYYCFKGQLQILSNQLEPAIITYLQVLEINPQSTDAMCNLGDLYNKTGKPNRGNEYYRKAAALGDKNAKYYLKSNGLNE